MKIVYNSKHSQQDCRKEMHYGAYVDSHENATRMDRMYAALKGNNNHTFMEPEDHGDSIIRQVHTDDYVNFLRDIWQRWAASGLTTPLIPSTWTTGSFGGEFAGGQSNSIPAQLGRYSFAADAAVTEGTWEAVYGGAQTAITAAKAVAAGDTAAFALTRPPGHHAHSDLCGGYCFINNAAVAAQAFRADGRKRVAILDIDFHHGNGTQSIFYDRSDVLTISLHGDPEDCFPFYLGFAGETGVGEGLGYNKNYPLPLGTQYDVWEATLKKACDDIVSFGADALVVPLGVDTHENDPISGFGLKTEDYTTVASILSALQLPTVITMEGGYDMESLGANVASFLDGWS